MARFNGPFKLVTVNQFCEGFEAFKPNEIAIENDSQGSPRAVWHICPCGECAGARRIPVNPYKTSNSQGANVGWDLVQEGEKISLSPSILDLHGCGSHYYIKNSMVEWC